MKKENPDSILKGEELIVNVDPLHNVILLPKILGEITKEFNFHNDLKGTDIIRNSNNDSLNVT